MSKENNNNNIYLKELSKLNEVRDIKCFIQYLTYTKYLINGSYYFHIMSST